MSDIRFDEKILLPWLDCYTVSISYFLDLKYETYKPRFQVWKLLMYRFQIKSCNLKFFELRQVSVPYEVEIRISLYSVLGV